MNQKSTGLLALILTLAVSIPAPAQQSAVTRQRAPKKAARANPWLPSLFLQYSAVSDLNDRNRERMYAHSLGAGADWSFTKAFTGSVMSGVGYTSVNNEIEKNNRSSMTDTFAGLGYRVKFSARHGLEVQGGIFFPTSETTQYEGQRGRYLALIRLRSKIASWYSVSNRISGQYIANTYDYSPTTDELNRRTMADYSLDNVFSAGHFFASFGLGARISTYVDDISELSYFNVSKIGVRAGGFSGFLAYMNGSYRDDQRLQPLFYDRYKKLVELGLSYGF